MVGYDTSQVFKGIATEALPYEDNKIKKHILMSNTLERRPWLKPVINYIDINQLNIQHKEGLFDNLKNII